MVCKINIQMDSQLSFKFTWQEATSLVGKVGTIIQKDKRTQRTGAVRLDASKPRDFIDKDGRSITVWDSQILVPSWIKNAMDEIFLANEDKLYPDLKFTIEIQQGAGYKAIGIPENAKKVSYSLLSQLPKYKGNATTVTNDKSADNDADKAADEVLG